MNATIRLFSALPITTKQTKKPSKQLLKETIRRGFAFAPEVVGNYSEQQLLDLIKIIEKEIGLTPEQMNNSFQKSWQKVKEAELTQLVVEQLIHYITTYGFERLGIYEKNSVYIPKADLSIPDLTEDVKLVIIRGYTKDELKAKLQAILESGIALAEDTIKDVIDIAILTELSAEDIHSIKNKEVKAILYGYFDFVPEIPIDFLRYLLYQTIDSTLIIKNQTTITEIKKAIPGKAKIVKIIKLYQEKYGLEKLAEIFYRFKPLFLAYRANSNLRPIINKLRKLAVKYHKPLMKDYLNEITAMIKHGVEIKQEKLQIELSKVSTFRKIRLAQALQYRLDENATSILYKIRNGKAYATEFSFNKKSQISDVLTVVVNSIIEDLKKNVSGKKIYIPSNITYAMPATEKQFTGNIPSGSSVSVDKQMIFGIHWENVGSARIDLDLSLINASNVKFGWDGLNRDDDKAVLFSGDNTDAALPHGAVELFYIDGISDTNFIMFVNYYNFNSKNIVPLKVLVAKDEILYFEDNHMVDPNKIQCIAKTKMDIRQKLLGLIITQPSGCTFYFNESNLGKGITASTKEYAQHARNYLFEYCTNALSFHDILQKAGAIFVDKKEKADLDLSPETLEKDTIINLLQ